MREVRKKVGRRAGDRGRVERIEEGQGKIEGDGRKRKEGQKRAMGDRIFSKST